MSSEKQTSKTGEKNGSSKDQASESQTLTLLQNIKSGSVNPSSLCPANRRLLVSFLIAEGQSTAEIALLLKTSDRTIERDRKAIRDENTITKDPERVKQMAGRLVTEADLCIQRICKSARGKDTPASVKVDAEHRCYQIVSDMIGSLQRLGYLPIATARLQADITHNIGQIPDYSQMQAEVQRLKQITGETQGTDSEVIEQLNQIETQLVKAKLVNQIENISNIVESKEVQNESDQ